MNWAQAFSDIIIAAATVALAVIAGLAIWREKREREEHRRATDARIGATAYMLRRQLKSWWPGNTWPGHDVDQKEKAEAIVPHLDRAEERLTELLTLAPEGSAEVGAAIRRAAVRFLEATESINEAAVTPLDPTTEDRFGSVGGARPAEVKGRFHDAFGLLIQTVENLESVIDEDLLREEETL